MQSTVSGKWSDLTTRSQMNHSSEPVIFFRIGWSSSLNQTEPFETVYGWSQHIDQKSLVLARQKFICGSITSIYDSMTLDLPTHSMLHLLYQYTLNWGTRIITVEIFALKYIYFSGQLELQAPLSFFVVSLTFSYKICSCLSLNTVRYLNVSNIYH